jgi:hypothetical protein
VRGIFIFNLENELEVVDGFFDVFPAVLGSVATDIFDDVGLAVGETVLLTKLNWLYGHVLVVPPTYLCVERVTQVPFSQRIPGSQKFIKGQ